MGWLLGGEDVDVRSWLIVGISFGIGPIGAGALLAEHRAADDELARMQPYLEASIGSARIRSGPHTGRVRAVEM